MEIYETRGHEEAAHIDLRLSHGSGEVPYPGDEAVAHSDVGNEAWAAAPVEDCAATEDDVVAGLLRDG
jgi:hypothetical protein